MSTAGVQLALALLFLALVPACLVVRRRSAAHKAAARCALGAAGALLLLLSGLERAAEVTSGGLARAVWSVAVALAGLALAVLSGRLAVADWQESRRASR